MSILIINTPSRKVEETKQSFEKTIKSCVGVGFAMSRTTLFKALKCTKVHILDKDAKKMAVAEMVGIIASQLVKKGMARYDIKFKKPLRCGYSKKVLLNRYGVGFKDGKNIVVAKTA
jgi:hypothetical protein